jgi:3-deoxy-D-manno-octulosonic-acid transferase
MFIVYDLIFLIIGIFYLPKYLFRRKFHRGFLPRLGILPKGLRLNNPIWIHAVSVGEVMAIRGLLKELRIIYPQKRFVVSTVTATGNKIACGMAEETDFITYLPLDLGFIIRRVIDKVNPSLFIIAETEIWPNLISYLYKKDIPVIIVNGRISDASFRGYRCIKLLLKPILNKINLFCLQTAGDAQRLLDLGVTPHKIQVTGNMKFDVKDYTDFKKDSTDYKSKLGLGPKEKLFVAASTHPGEEEIILGVYKELFREFPDLKLLIAPRHPERSKEVGRLIENNGLGEISISKLGAQTNNRTEKTPVFLLDTIGQLLNYYAVADIVFVGGSLARTGGHNILEPAALGKPVIFGPYMHNFRDIADLFLKNKAAILIRNPEELKAKVRYLLNNPSALNTFAQNAKAVIIENQGATRRNLEYITANKLCR